MIITIDRKGIVTTSGLRNVEANQSIEFDNQLDDKVDLVVLGPNGQPYPLFVDVDGRETGRPGSAVSVFTVGKNNAGQHHTRQIIATPPPGKFEVFSLVCSRGGGGPINVG